MDAYFLDSSALVKRYMHETGTAWVTARTDPAGSRRIYLARMTAVEVTSAIARRRRGGRLTPGQAAAVLAQFDQEFRSYFRLVEITSTLITEAALLAEKYSLRAYDAVQLAAVSRVQAHRVAGSRSPVILVSADLDLNTAATAMGIAVEDPNQHP